MTRESILVDSQYPKQRLGRQKINIIPLSQNSGNNAKGLACWEFRNRMSKVAALETSDDSVSCCHLKIKASSPPPSAKVILKSLFMNGGSYVIAKLFAPEHFRPSKRLADRDRHVNYVSPPHI